MGEAKIFRYALKLHTGKLVYGEGVDADDAARYAGVAPADVKRSLPVAWVNRPAMTEEVKQKLRELTKRRKKAEE